nr:hypothetical protein [Tanacetum cinerariifolium]
MNVHDLETLEDSLPLKEKDPRSFIIPFHINNICFAKALADLGVSISVMSYSTFTNLGLGELASTKLILELADRTIKRPKGIAENVLVGIDKFVFLVDFIVLDMLKEIIVPLILRRPFLYTAHAKIDVFKKKIALRVGNDKIIFKIVENIDAYQDQDMGEVIMGKPFCQVSCIEARRFDRLITIHSGNDSVAYQMA